MDLRMNPSCQICLSLTSKLKHTWRKPWGTVADETDRRRVLIASLTSNPNWPGRKKLKKIQPLKPLTPSFEPFHSLFLPFPSLFNFQLPTSLLYQLITSPIPQILKIYSLLVGVCCCGFVLSNKLPHFLVFLLFSRMCLWFLPIYIAFLFIN